MCILKLLWERPISVKKNKRPLYILIVDDDKEPVEILRRDAESSRFRMKLVHCTSLEFAKETIKSKGVNYFAGVILDAQCSTEKNGLADGGFVGSALKYFQQEDTSVLPLVFLTGVKNYYDRIKDMHRGYKVYHKGGEGTEDMLSYLREQGEALDHVKETRKVTEPFPDVFSIFEKEYLDSKVEQELITCLKNMNSGELPQIKSNLVLIRGIQEQIYIALKKNNSTLIPDKHMKPRVNVPGIYKHLTDTGKVKEYSIVYHFASTIYNVASAGGSHTPYDVFYEPTKYTVQACIYAMLDLLLWFKSVMEGNTI